MAFPGIKLQPLRQKPDWFNPLASGRKLRGFSLLKLPSRIGRDEVHLRHDLKHKQTASVATSLLCTSWQQRGRSSISLSKTFRCGSHGAVRKLCTHQARVNAE
eukprot:5787239-Amphidinium_carterae.1